MMPATTVMIVSVVSELDVVVRVPGPGPDVFTFTADQTRIPNDGQTKVTFTAMLNDENVTSSAKIFKDGMPFDGHTFSSLKPGGYKFRAEYDDMASREIMIIVDMMPPLLISVNKSVQLLKPGSAAGQFIFTVTRDGVDITDKCTFQNILDGTKLPNNVFTTKTAGTYQFFAYITAHGNAVDRHRSDNISVGLGYEPLISTVFDPNRTLHKKVAVFVFTATWCGPCTALKDALKNLGYMQPHLTTINIYGSERTTTAVAENSLGGRLKTQVEPRFNVGTLPTAILDFRAKQGGRANEYVDDYVGYPAKTGIMVQSKINGSKLDFTVTVGAQEAGTYYLGAIMVEDNVIAPQNGKSSYNHTDVVRVMASSTINGDLLGTMARGETKIKTHSIAIPAKCKKENLSVFVYTLYKNTNGEFIIANSVKAPANGTAGFAYMD